MEEEDSGKFLSSPTLSILFFILLKEDIRDFDTKLV